MRSSSQERTHRHSPASQPCGLTAPPLSAFGFPGTPSHRLGFWPVHSTPTRSVVPTSPQLPQAQACGRPDRSGRGGGMRTGPQELGASTFTLHERKTHGPLHGSPRNRDAGPSEISSPETESSPFLRLRPGPGPSLSLWEGPADLGRRVAISTSLDGAGERPSAPQKATRRAAKASGAWLLSRTLLSAGTWPTGHPDTGPPWGHSPGPTLSHRVRVTHPRSPVTSGPPVPDQSSCTLRTRPPVSGVPAPAPSPATSWACRDGVARGKHVCDPPRSRKQGRPSGSSLPPQLRWREREKVGGG